MDIPDTFKETGEVYVPVHRLWKVSGASVLGLVILAFFLAGTGRGCADMGEMGISAVSSTPESFSVYTLSRGKGVPEEARNVLEEARGLLKTAHEEGAVTRLTDQRIGLEGETRLCAEFRDGDSARTILSRIQNLSRGIDLVNVTIEPCPQ